MYEVIFFKKTGRKSMEDSGVLRFDLVRIHLFLHHIHIYSMLII